MLNRYTLIIIATIVAVFFTSLVYILPKYSTLWFTLEFIILPIVYIVGYELLMEKQDKIYNAIENAKTLRNKILWDGLTSDEELSEELQLAFEDVSLAIMELQRISERTQ